MALTQVSEEEIRYAKTMVAGSTIGFLLDALGGGVPISSPKQGYFVGPLNGEKLLAGIEVEDAWRSVVEIGSYRSNSYVADSPEAFIEKYHDILDQDERIFAVFFSPIVREEQDPSGGWRWHKWGEYLGEHEPQHEYLYDEEGIDRVYIVRVLHVTY